MPPILSSFGSGSVRGFGRGRVAAPTLAEIAYRSQDFSLSSSTSGTGAGPDGSIKPVITDSTGGQWYLYFNFGNSINRWSGVQSKSSSQSSTGTQPSYSFDQELVGFGESFNYSDFSGSNHIGFYTDSSSTGLSSVASWIGVEGALDAEFGSQTSILIEDVTMFAIQIPTNSKKVLLGFGNVIGDDAAVALVTTDSTNAKYPGSTAFAFDSSNGTTSAAQGGAVTDAGLFNIVYDLEQLGVNNDAGIVIVEGDRTAPHVFYFLAQ